MVHLKKGKPSSTFHWNAPEAVTVYRVESHKDENHPEISLILVPKVKTYMLIIQWQKITYKIDS